MLSGTAEVRLFTGKDVFVRAFEFAIRSEDEAVEIAEAAVGPQMERWSISCQDGVEGYASRVASHLDSATISTRATATSGNAAAAGNDTAFLRVGRHSNSLEERGVRGTAKEGRVIALLKLASPVKEGRLPTITYCLVLDALQVCVV